MDQTTTKRKALVIDDEPDFSAFVAATLRAADFDVAIAHDGAEAMTRIQEDTPDLITLDIHMPKKSGMVFYRQIKSRAKFCNIPVIVITGLTRDDPQMTMFIKAFLEVEHLPMPDAYLEKPLDTEAFLEKAREVLH